MMLHKCKVVLQSIRFCIWENLIIAVMIPSVLRACLETMMAAFPLDSGSPFSSSPQALAALSIFNKATCCNDHIKHYYKHTHTHLIGLYKASK